MEHVHDEAAEVEQCPFRGRAAFAMLWRALQVLVQLLFDFAADGFDLRRAEAGTDHEIGCEAAHFAQIENRNRRGFLVLCCFNCETHAFREGIELHCRYKSCFKMYS